MIRQLWRRDLTVSSKISMYGQLIGDTLAPLGFTNSAQDKLRDMVEAHYGENHRHYHNIDHITDMLLHFHLVADGFTDREKAILMLAILFHDMDYDPLDSANEEKSARRLGWFWREVCPGNMTKPELERCANLILSTKLFHYEELMSDPLALALRRLDIWNFLQFNPSALIASTWKLFKEFQVYPWNQWVEGRIKFLSTLMAKLPETDEAARFCLDYEKTMEPRIGFFAGSFQPPHIGHLSVLRQAEQVFDKVILATGINRAKREELDEVNYSCLRMTFQWHEVVKYYTLLPRAMYKVDLNPTLIRGLRTDTDFKHEEELLHVFQDIRPDMRAIYIPCDHGTEHVSSKVLRELNHFEKDLGTRLYGITKREIYNLAE